jgi:hypothetical protein
MEKRFRRVAQGRDHVDGGLGRSWRQAAYAFVDIAELESTGDDVGALVEVAVVEHGESDIGALIDAGGPVRWLAPRRPSHRGGSRLGARPPADVCTIVRGRLTGRVVVMHGLGVSWRTLAAICSPLPPVLVLDSLALAGQLLPTGDTSLAALMERLGERLTEAEARRAGVGESVSNSVILARVFHSMVERTLPGATVGDLVRLAGQHSHGPLPDLGLEGGQ